MPRQQSYSKDALTELALQQFWRFGYNASSMDDLVNATSVSRHGIYATFGGKKQMFLACFDQYQETVVTPAFGMVEQPDASIENIAAYFEHHISKGEILGLPGPGCFVANSATEVAPFDDDTKSKVRLHNDRLRQGFRHALANAFQGKRQISKEDIDAMAETAVIFTNGLWSMSRTVSTADPLRQAVSKFLQMIEQATS